MEVRVMSNGGSETPGSTPDGPLGSSDPDTSAETPDLPITEVPDEVMVDTEHPREDKRRKRRLRNPLGPSDAQVRANVAGEASADAAIALQAESGGSVPLDLTAAAFFDVDNTMVQGASIIHFARGLAARKYFTSSDLAQFAWQQVKFRVSGKENSDDVASGREKALSFIKGRSTAELRLLGEEIYDELIADKIWPGTATLAQMHLDAGQQVWLVTATPLELAQIIAERLGLTGALGTVAESNDGIFTGRLVGDILHGLGKAHAVRTLAVREGLNLKRCTAYSDSHNDVPMLSLVGTAVAVNPDADLRELAKNRGWEIRDFRTGRKAAKIGVPTALALGAVGGGLAAVIGRRRA
ncbi:haloacid dehalogenase [Rhodococcus sp. 06-156-3C]|nr:haloacid dehalogenase [Rhodococcus sp. 06-156-4C]OZD19533.1 haloacid dehalogenase [Rhodococcus sp. 06-156-4a]OZD23153.1 haloacid dehalogenase [Rhodococcus sp. 06-156-3C]OZD25552.1 haloacid dehalogenase [Rhodococcus sp. 06-156-3b]OZD37759.1 haloacid dehalogenase [Rhodococcus sp. 06-156-3]OZF68750.1 haloacid dehalogenase [Rhodococcus sp. 06-156-4]